jgi:glycosyltransferase involved in cell wall biosynthesis
VRRYSKRLHGDVDGPNEAGPVLGGSARSIGRPAVALYYSSLRTMGGGERQWADELRAYRKAGVDAVGLTHSAPPEAVRELHLESNVVQLPGAGVLRRALSLDAWVTAVRPTLLVAHTSPELTYLATRRTRQPYVLYQNSPIFYGDFHKNPYPFALQHRRAFQEFLNKTPGYREFAQLPSIGPIDRARLELRAKLKALAIRKATHVVVVSRRVAREVEAVYGVTAAVIRGSLDERLLAYRPTVDVRRRHGIGRSPLLVSVSRLDKIKRIDLLLNAYAQLLKTVPDARLLIGGTGPEEPALRTLARCLGLDDQSIFLGYLPEAEVWDYYASGDVFVAPATADFILTPYEALVLNRKVVVSADLEFEQSLVDSGLVFTSASNPASLASAIRDALAASPKKQPDLSALYAGARVASLIALFRDVPGWRD